MICVWAVLFKVRVHCSGNGGVCRTNKRNNNAVVQTVIVILKQKKYYDQEIKDKFVQTYFLTYIGEINSVLIVSTQRKNV